MEDHYGLIELLLVFGIVLALALREVISLRRERRRDREAAALLRERRGDGEVVPIRRERPRNEG
jgi:hypothetical protein